MNNLQLAGWLWNGALYYYQDYCHYQYYCHISIIVIIRIVVIVVIIVIISSSLLGSELRDLAQTFVFAGSVLTQCLAATIALGFLSQAFQWLAIVFRV